MTRNYLLRDVQPARRGHDRRAARRRRDRGDRRRRGGRRPVRDAGDHQRQRPGRCCRASSTCTRTCASRAGRTPRRSAPARAPRRWAASPRCTRWPTRRPTQDTAGVVEQVWRLGRDAGWVDVRPVGAVTVGLEGERLAELGAMAESAAQVRVFSDDGKCVHDPVAHAPRAGVRQGVRRRHRPARAGAAAHRGRPDARGRRLRRARAGRLARGRRGGDHRPRRAARRARRLAPARLPPVHRRARSRSSAGPSPAASTSPPRSPRTT